MSILIKGMEMPIKKNGAVLIIYPDGKSAFEDGKTYQAVPVPPHGDMKDINHINQVLDRFSGYLDDDMIYRLKIAIGRDAPTVIPASKEDK